MALLCLVALSPAAASGGGGRTIGDAPQIPLGQEQLNALNGIDFYRVALRSGDRLTLRYGPQHRYSWVEICLFQPGITDTTVGNQPCYALESTTNDESFTVTARLAGDWVIALMPAGCRKEAILDLRCTSGVQYFLSAFVKHQTAVTLQGPNAVRRGSWLQLSGRLSGTKGTVVFDGSWDAGAHWAALGLKRVGSSGRFSTRFRMRRRGTLQVRVAFPEAPLYVPSSATISVRVV